MQSVQ